MPVKFKTYSEYLAEKFGSEHKIQKISVTLGTSCPNRDGTIGYGGCAYCNNTAFSPNYILSESHSESVRETIIKGKEFFARKYPEMKYLAYFQSYTNTHGKNHQSLLNLYQEAAAVKDIVGLVIGTRPDCIDDNLFASLGEINRTKLPIIIEFGAESSHDATLQKVNRCHDWSATVEATKKAAKHNISVGLHFIMGLPGETEDMMLETVRRAVKLPIGTLKFHQLQIIKGTRFERDYLNNPEEFNLFSPENYASLCKRIIEIVSPTGIAIERFVSQSPSELLIAPRWGLKNYQFINLLNSAKI